MSGRLTRSAYDVLIEGDLKWLSRQPSSLENRHIELIVRRSTDQEYGKEDKGPAYLRLDYIDNCIEQTILWMNGVSEHANDECTVDFSCCNPDLITPEAKRLVQGALKLRGLIERRKEAVKLNG